MPLPPGRTGASGAGIRQPPEVFDGADVDPTRPTVTTAGGLKRTVRTTDRSATTAPGPTPRPPRRARR